MTQLVNYINDLFVSVSGDLPMLDPTYPVFDIEEPLPAELTIEAASTQRALQKVKSRKETGPDSIPPWMVTNNYYGHLLAAPVTAIFNSSLREGTLPDLWKTATAVPVPKKHLRKLTNANSGIIRHRYDGRLGGDGPYVV